jgi:hypothetical protein
MTKGEDAYSVGTIVRIRKTGQFAIIRKKIFLKEGMNFLHYLGEIEGREGLYSLYHEDVDLESLPPQN